MQRLQTGQDVRRLLGLDQRPQLLEQVLPVEAGTLADEDALDIQPVASPVRKRFHHDQVFRTAQAERYIAAEEDKA